jgi:transcriptional regulator of nitric oxide reductase
MAIAHFFSIKLPILFVYYDVPFHAYQDKIISFCVVTYSIFFYGAYQNRVLAPYAILSMIATVLGLSLINFSGDLKSVLNGGTTTMYWLQTGMIALILVWLAVFYMRAKKSETK